MKRRAIFISINISILGYVLYGLALSLFSSKTDLTVADRVARSLGIPSLIPVLIFAILTNAAGIVLELCFKTERKSTPLPKLLVAYSLAAYLTAQFFLRRILPNLVSYINGTGFGDFFAGNMTVISLSIAAISIVIAIAAEIRHGKETVLMSSGACIFTVVFTCICATALTTFIM